jgi:hypothetical protein
MPQDESSAGPQNAEKWALAAGPERMVPWEDPDVSAAWVWTMRHRVTGESRELSVRVSWKGFESIDEVPSAVAREAFQLLGRPGVFWFMNHTSDAWAQIIFHAQSRGGPHGSTGRQEIVRIP